jgi:hypothetical protein
MLIEIDIIKIKMECGGGKFYNEKMVINTDIVSSIKYQAAKNHSYVLFLKDTDECYFISETTKNQIMDATKKIQINTRNNVGYIAISNVQMFVNYLKRAIQNTDSNIFIGSNIGAKEQLQEIRENIEKFQIELN